MSEANGQRENGLGSGPLVLSLSRQGVVFFAVLLAASALFGYRGILASQCAADALSAVLAVCILRFGRMI